MSLALVDDWASLERGDHVDVYVKGADVANYDDMTVTFVDPRGTHITAWSDSGGWKLGPIFPETYDLVKL